MIKSLINKPKELRKIYIDEGKSLTEIAKTCGVAFQTVHKWLKKNDIPLRAWSTKGMGWKFMGHVISEETKKKISKAHMGKKLSPEHRKKVIKALSKYWVKGKRHHSWKGGFVDKCGYKIIQVDGKTMREHRHLMEKHLGRKLKRREHIHHINGDRLDNRIKNLTVLTPEEHTQIHWTNPEMIRLQSERLKKIRAKKWWSSKAEKNK